jgi:HMG (high mobility group) box
MSVSDAARELGIRWKNAPAEVKNRYEIAASEKKNVYLAEMALYKHQAPPGSSPPETPQTPVTPHDYPSNYSSSTMQVQQHPQLQQILLQQQQQQQQNFHSYDNGDTPENLVEFDMLTSGNSLDDNEE